VQLQETAATLWACSEVGGTIATASVAAYLEAVGESRGAGGRRWLAERTPDVLGAAAAVMAPGAVRDRTAATLRVGLGMSLTEDAFYDFLAAAHEVLRFDGDAFDAMAAAALKTKYGDPESAAAPSPRPTYGVETGFYAPNYGRSAPPPRPTPATHGRDAPPARRAPTPSGYVASQAQTDASAAAQSAAAAHSGRRMGEARFGVATDWKARLERARGAYAPRIEGAAEEPAPAPKGPKRHEPPKGPRRHAPPARAAPSVVIDHPLARDPSPGGGPCLSGLTWGEIDRLLGAP